MICGAFKNSPFGIIKGLTLGACILSGFAIVPVISPNSVYTFGKTTTLSEFSLHDKRKTNVDIINANRMCFLPSFLVFFKIVFNLLNIIKL